MTALANSEWLRDAPLIIAHRGASHAAPENTLAAFRLAEQMGADAIELDVRLTGDGQVVVHHDRTLERTTTGAGKLSDHTLDQIQQLDAGSKFDGRFAGERVPTLDQVLNAIGRSLLLNIDLANYDTPRDSLAEAAVAAVRRLGIETRVMFSSFNPRALRRAHRMAPEIPTALLVVASGCPLRRSLARLISPQWAYHPQDGLVDSHLIASEHRSGRRVNVWTVNEAARIRQLLEWGADGVITDVPDVACRLGEERARGA